MKKKTGLVGRAGYTYAEETYSEYNVFTCRQSGILLSRLHAAKAKTWIVRESRQPKLIGPNGLIWTGRERRLGPKGLLGQENGNKLI
jgi:hypothetical protein